MHTSELLKHIYDINLSYLLLAQRLISQDKASAMFRLGINEEMATMLGGLTLPQMVKLAETNQLVCQFRFDNPQTIMRLTQNPALTIFNRSIPVFFSPHDCSAKSASLMTLPVRKGHNNEREKHCSGSA